MSTPYVGIKRVSQQSRLFGNAAWMQKPLEEPTVNAEPEAIESPQPAPLEVWDARLRLIALLRDEAGISAIQVGSFIMALNEHVPTRHLIMSAHWLVAEWREEANPTPLADMVEECLLMLGSAPANPAPMRLPELDEADLS